MSVFFTQLENKIYSYKNAYPDKPRKVATHMMMWCFKSLFKRFQDPLLSHKSSYAKSILFNLEGGIGDIIICINFLIQLHKKYGFGFDFYITVPDVFYDTAVLLLANCDGLKLCDKTNNPDTHMAELTFCRVPEIKSINWDVIRAASEPMFTWLQHIYEFNIKYPEYLKSGTIADFLLTNFTRMSGRNRLTQADIDNMVGIKTVYEIPVRDAHGVLSKYGLETDKYVTLQCGIGALSGNGLSTREWPVEKYNELIKLLKKHNKNLVLVQIGTASDPAMNADIDLRGKTSFNEFLAILKNAKLHIGGESGCIHMRHFMGAHKSAVLFGPTFMDFYSYPENINISSGICSGCEWMHNGWRELCIQNGTCHSLCLQKLTANNVFNKIKVMLK